MTLAHLLAWFPMLAVAFANGALREIVLVKHVNPLAAHRISCVLGSCLLFAFIMALGRWLPFATAKEALLTGLTWLVMTVAFEFLFGRYRARKTWQELLADYDIASGRLWLLVLFTVLATPFLSWLF